MFRRIIEAAYGLPHLHRILYFEIASHADYTTGVAGLKRRISMQALREAVWVEPAPGRTDSGNASRDSIRKAIKYLSSNGYLVERGPLVFEVAVLTRGQSVQKQRTANGPVMDTQETRGPVANSFDTSSNNITNIIPSGAQRTDKGPLIGPTSDLDDFNGGAISVQGIASLFVSKYHFQATQALTPKTVEKFKQWIAAGATLELICETVDTVMSKPRKATIIGSPSYFHDEIMQVLNGTRSQAHQPTGTDPLATWGAPPGRNDGADA